MVKISPPLPSGARIFKVRDRILLPQEREFSRWTDSQGGDPLGARALFTLYALFRLAGSSGLPKLTSVLPDMRAEAALSTSCFNK